MSKSAWHTIGYFLYGIAVLDLAVMFLSYDITGVFWSPIVFGGAGYLCFFYTKEPTLEEGEELLVLADGKQANVSVVIGTGQNASHKLFLTNQTIQIDGPKVNVAWP